MRTNKGHELVHVQDLQFSVRAVGLTATPDGKPCRLSMGLAFHAICVPTTRGRMIAELRAWVSVYDDEELLTQVEGVVAKALASLPEKVHEPPPAAVEAPSPAKAEMN